ncbi:MAG: VCBS repeat-containing protein [Bryobacterales bacterium]|nr:VCBS repeat-containing protein [Bryobacterales bacterium]
MAVLACAAAGGWNCNNPFDYGRPVRRSQCEALLAGQQTEGYYNGSGGFRVPFVHPLTNATVEESISVDSCREIINEVKRGLARDADARLLGGGLRRVADGSFTSDSYDFVTLSLTRTVPNIQSKLQPCYPLRAVTRPANWTFLGNTAGVASMDTVAANLGSGAGSILGTAASGNALTVVSSNADYTFKDLVNYPTGVNPNGLLVADLNGDGKRDVIVVNEGQAPTPGSLSVFTGKGDGTLNAPATVALSGRAISATSHDFNGDGKVDIAVLVEALDFTGTSAIVLLGRGDGTFLAPAAFAVSSNAGGIAAGDFNGDSRIDLAVAALNSVDLLLGNGNGTFQAVRSTPSGDFNGYSLAPGDFNRDGKQDLAIADYPAGTISIWFSNSNGDGTFPTRRRYAARSGVIPLVVVDFDWDGYLDVLQGKGHPDMLIPGAPVIAGMYNVGDGTFCAGPAHKVGTLPRGALGDVNADGKPDLLTTSMAGGLMVSLGQGGSAFAPAVNYPTSNGSNAPTATVAAADFNGDGKLDALIAAPNNPAPESLYFYPGNGNGTFGTAAARNGGAQPYGIAAGDFNADGKQDIAVGQGSGEFPATAATVLVSLGVGDGTFQAPVSYATCPNSFQVQAADLNGDQKLDILVTCGRTPNASDTGGVVVLTGAGNGTFVASAKMNAGTTPVSAVATDLNGDGRLDIVSSASGQLVFLAGQASGGYASPQSRGAVTGDLLATDFDADGRRDLIIGGNSNFCLYRGLGDGTVENSRCLAAGGQIRQGLATDLNADAKPDLIAIGGNFGVPPDGASSFAVIMNLGQAFGSAITSPAPNTTLTGASVNFTWQNAGAGASYKLDVGSLPGGADLFTLTTTATTAAVTGLPTDGRNVYARLTTTVNGTARIPQDYAYTAATAAPAAVISTPAPGSTLTSAAVTFTWGPITGATYKLDIGSSAGATDLFTATTTNTSQAVTGLPVDGRTLYVRLTTTTGSGPGSNSYTYRAAATGVAVITSPVNFSPLRGNSTVFTWTAAANATSYKLDIGNTAGAADVFTGATAALTLNAINLPTDGRTLYARLTTFIGATALTPVDAIYRAAGAGLRFVSMPPCRVMETRVPDNFQGRTGPFGPPSLQAGETRTMSFPQSNVCSIPTAAKAYVVNVTLVPHGAVDTVTVWPAGEPRPNVYTVRSLDGNIVANSAIVKAGANNGVSVYTSHASDVLIDISGYYTDNATLSNLTYYPLTPCRVLDTRAVYRQPAGPFGPPTMGRDETRRFRFPVTPYCTVPGGAAAYSVTITVAPPGPMPYLTAWPAGGQRPNVSSLNSFLGRTLANSVIIPASSDGSIDVYTFDASDVLIDINGYYAPDDGVNGLYYYPVTQCRASDSRAANTIYADETARTIAIPTAAACTGIPATAKGYALTVTSESGGNPMPFITAYPTGQSRPGASILNAFEGQVVTNSAIVPAGTNGAVDIFAYRRTHVVVDVSGFFSR